MMETVFTTVDDLLDLGALCMFAEEQGRLMMDEGAVAASPN